MNSKFDDGSPSSQHMFRCALTVITLLLGLKYSFNNLSNIGYCLGQYTSDFAHLATCHERLSLVVDTLHDKRLSCDPSSRVFSYTLLYIDAAVESR